MAEHVDLACITIISWGLPLFNILYLRCPSTCLRPHSSFEASAAMSAISHKNGSIGLYESKMYDSTDTCINEVTRGIGGLQ